MKRRKKTIVIIAVFLVVALLITGYIRFLMENQYILLWE